MKIYFGIRQWVVMGVVSLVVLAAAAVGGYWYLRGTQAIEQSTNTVSPEMQAILDQGAADERASRAAADALEQKIQALIGEHAQAPITTGTDALGKYTEQNSIRDYTEALGRQIEVVGDDRPSWLSAADTDQLLTGVLPQYPQIKSDYAQKCCDATKESCYGDDFKEHNMCASIKVLKIGHITAPTKLANKPVYLIYFPLAYNSMEMTDDYYKLAFVDDNSHKLIQLHNISQYETAVNFSMQDPVRFQENLVYTVLGKDKIMGAGLNDHRWFSGTIDLAFDLNRYLKFDELISLPNQNFKLVFLNRTTCNQMWSPLFCGLESITSGFYPGVGETDYLAGSSLFYEDTKYGQFYSFPTSCVKLANPNGVLGEYETVPNFFQGVTGAGYPDEHTLAVQWKRAANAKDKYQAITTGSCRAFGCLSFVDPAWFDEKNLVEIGTANNGDKLYELSDKATNAHYQGIFNYTEANMQYVSEQAQLSSSTPEGVQAFSDALYKKFIDDQPLFFWKDSLGRWHSFMKSKYRPAVECGKPVIYLYPTRDTKVNVQVAPNGGLTKVDPEYPTGGWSVMATPKSELTNLADGQKYPYLFWEGKAYDLSIPKEGFVLARGEVAKRMTDLLAQLGLNAKETADFLEFWQPKLQESPYVLVSFVPQRDFDAVAPLTVTPRPDRVIRVFMNYVPLSAPVTISPQKLTTPTRTGFTVVEWGGRLIK